VRHASAKALNDGEPWQAAGLAGSPLLQRFRRLRKGVGQENITILHWNNEIFRDKSLKSQLLVKVNQARCSLSRQLGLRAQKLTMHT
jgi:hypothetical protein